MKTLILKIILKALILKTPITKIILKALILKTPITKIILKTYFKDLYYFFHLHFRSSGRKLQLRNYGYLICSEWSKNVASRKNVTMMYATTSCCDRSALTQPVQTSWPHCISCNRWSPVHFPIPTLYLTNSGKIFKISITEKDGKNYLLISFLGVRLELLWTKSS